jgi:hypothetical protein
MASHQNVATVFENASTCIGGFLTGNGIGFYFMVAAIIEEVPRGHHHHH